MNNEGATLTEDQRAAKVDLLGFFDRLIITSRLGIKRRVRRLIERSLEGGKVELREAPRTGSENPTTELIIPAQRDYLVLPRLIASGIGLRLSHTLEMIEEQKLALTEAGENALSHAFEGGAGSILYRYTTSPEELTIEVIDNGRGIASGLIDENKRWVGHDGGLGFFLMQSLVDRLEIESEPGEGTLVRLITERPTTTLPEEVAELRPRSRFMIAS